jgi:hypothetical protein
VGSAQPVSDCEDVYGVRTVLHVQEDRFCHISKPDGYEMKGLSTKSLPAKARKPFSVKEVKKYRSIRRIYKFPKLPRKERAQKVCKLITSSGWLYQSRFVVLLDSFHALAASATLKTGAAWVERLAMSVSPRTARRIVQATL